MLLLINSSAGAQSTIALADGGRVLASSTGPARQAERDLLLLSIQRLLKRTKQSLSVLQGVAVVTGPGPFSALRAGIATANALAYSLGVPVVGVSADEAHDLGIFTQAAAANIVTAKLGEPVIPAYGAEPNITLKA